MMMMKMLMIIYKSLTQMLMMKKSNFIRHLKMIVYKEQSRILILILIQVTEEYYGKIKNLNLIIEIPFNLETMNLKKIL